MNTLPQCDAIRDNVENQSFLRKERIGAAGNIYENTYSVLTCYTR